MAGDGRVSIEGKFPDVREVYARCDVVVCPVGARLVLPGGGRGDAQRHPGGGSDLEPIRDLLGDDEAGLVFPVGDTAAAGAAVTRLVGDPACAPASAPPACEPVPPAFAPAAVRRPALDRRLATASATRRDRPAGRAPGQAGRARLSCQRARPHAAPGPGGRRGAVDARGRSRARPAGRRRPPRRRPRRPASMSRRHDVVPGDSGSASRAWRGLATDLARDAALAGSENAQHRRRRRRGRGSRTDPRPPVPGSRDQRLVADLLVAGVPEPRAGVPAGREPRPPVEGQRHRVSVGLDRHRWTAPRPGRPGRCARSGPRGTSRRAAGMRST